MHGGNIKQLFTLGPTSINSLSLLFEYGHLLPVSLALKNAEYLLL